MKEERVHLNIDDAEIGEMTDEQSEEAVSERMRQLGISEEDDLLAE